MFLPIAHFVFLPETQFSVSGIQLVSLLLGISLGVAALLVPGLLARKRHSCLTRKTEVKSSEQDGRVAEILNQLRESEERFRRSFEESPIGLYRAAPDGQIVMANSTALRLFGCESQESLACISTAGTIREVADASFGPTASEYSWQLPDGRFVTIRENVLPVRADDGQVQYFLGTLEDVTERHGIETKLRERETLFRRIIDQIPCGIYWKDRQSSYLGCNEQFANDQGLRSPEQIVGKTDHELPYGPIDAGNIATLEEHVILSGEPILSIEATQTRAGSKSELLASIGPLWSPSGDFSGVLGIYLDITERKRLEEQFRQAQKMEAVGQLAGGIAHDFNNLLTVISGNIALLGHCSLDEATSDLVKDARDAAARAAKLVRQILTFSRRQPARVEVLDLNRVIEDCGAMLRRLLGEPVKLVVELARVPMPVRADQIHLEQVILNLAVNARDAMPRGGTLTLSTGYSPREGRVRFSVGDTGSGMTKEVQARIFEPFFTTKSPERGTGLGLATVHGIVHQAGGAIEVRSTPGQGTTFNIDLPLHAAPTDLNETVPDTVDSTTFSAGGRRILVVEDEATIRKLIRFSLEREGFEVLEAEDGEDALEQVAIAGTVDLLVTDLTMPGISGWELAEQLRAMQPDVRIIFSSGYSDEFNALANFDHAEFLAKPFSPDELVRVARRLLDPAAAVP